MPNDLIELAPISADELLPVETLNRLSLSFIDYPRHSSPVVRRDDIVHAAKVLAKVVKYE